MGLSSVRAIIFLFAVLFFCYLYDTMEREVKYFLELCGFEKGYFYFLVYQRADRHIFSLYIFIYNKKCYHNRFIRHN